MDLSPTPSPARGEAARRKCCRSCRISVLWRRSPAFHNTRYVHAAIRACAARSRHTGRAAHSQSCANGARVTLARAREAAPASLFSPMWRIPAKGDAVVCRCARKGTHVPLLHAPRPAPGQVHPRAGSSDRDPAARPRPCPELRRRPDRWHSTAGIVRRRLTPAYSPVALLTPLLVWRWSARTGIRTCSFA